MNTNTAIKKILQGRSTFIGDIQDREALSVKVKRSSVCRGRIRAIVFPAMPEDVRVIRSADIPGKNNLSVFGTGIPILSGGEVRYKGEPVLLLAGPDDRVLENLIEQIIIDYEEEEPLLAFEFPKPGQIIYSRKIERGDVDKAFSRAAHVVAEEFSTGMQEHYYSEPHGVYVKWENEESSLRVYSSSRWPYHVHITLCEALALPYELASVSVPGDPDRSLDGKLWYPSLAAVHAALAAWITKKNVKMLYSREEDFLYTPKRSPSVIRYRAGLDKEGNLLALDAEILLNIGAYPIFTKEMADRAAFGAQGGYFCPNTRIQASGVETNLPPMGPFSGMGGAMSLFAVELLAEKIREEAGTGPVEWKKANLISRGRPGLTGSPARHSLPSPELFDLAAGMSDFDRKHASFELARKRRTAENRVPDYHRGIGIALGCQGTGFLGDTEDRLGTSLELSIDTEGKVTISQSAVPGSYALHQIWRRMVQESLGVDPDDVKIPTISTGEGIDSGPSTFSRGIAIVTKLLEDCCDLIKKKRFRSPLPLSAAKTFHLPRTNPWDDAAFSGDPFLFQAWASAVVELRVDPLSLSPEISGIWMAVDGGRILDEKEARRTLEIETSQAVGWAIRERLAYENGLIPRSRFAAYRIPSTCDLPSPVIRFLETGGRRPVKGIGELALSCIPAACAAAFGQALGTPVREIPFSPEEVLP